MSPSQTANSSPAVIAGSGCLRFARFMRTTYIASFFIRFHQPSSFFFAESGYPTSSDVFGEMCK